MNMKFRNYGRGSKVSNDNQRRIETISPTVYTKKIDFELKSTRFAIRKMRLYSHNSEAKEAFEIAIKIHQEIINLKDYLEKKRNFFDNEESLVEEIFSEMEGFLKIIKGLEEYNYSFLDKCDSQFDIIYNSIKEKMQKLIHYKN